MWRQALRRRYRTERQHTSSMQHLGLKTEACAVFLSWVMPVARRLHDKSAPARSQRWFKAAVINITGTAGKLETWGFGADPIGGLLLKTTSFPRSNLPPELGPDPAPVLKDRNVSPASFFISLFSFSLSFMKDVGTIRWKSRSCTALLEVPVAAGWCTRTHCSTSWWRSKLGEKWQNYYFNLETFELTTA